jgi:hypothetical protein
MLILAAEGSISFLDLSQKKFEYTKTTLIVPIAISTWIPSKLFSNIKCKLSGDSGFAFSTNFTVANEINPQFTCYFNTLSSGLKNISLWYKDSSNEFLISNNNLELVFAGIFDRFNNEKIFPLCFLYPHLQLN